MILTLQRQVHEAISEAVRRQYGVSDVPPFAVEVPPNRALGDLGVTVAFQLARALRKAPRAIAQELAAAITVPGISRVDDNEKARSLLRAQGRPEAVIWETCTTSPQTSQRMESQ